MATWNDPSIVDSYANASGNPEKNWYEEEVNVPSILSLLPPATTTVLDFGCGPGNLTKRLSANFTATGADGASHMVDKARAVFPGLAFFEWDGQTKLPDEQQPFDAIVTKLTLEFIEDLSVIARNFYEALVPGGVLIISVQHPLLAISMHPEQDIPYWSMPAFDVQIGTTGTTVTKVHRNLQQYTEPFTDAGFAITTITEPEIPADVASRRNATPADLKFPKRLNIAFTRPQR